MLRVLEHTLFFFLWNCLVFHCNNDLVLLGAAIFLSSSLLGFDNIIFFGAATIAKAIAMQIVVFVVVIIYHDATGYAATAALDDAKAAAAECNQGWWEHNNAISVCNKQSHP